MTESPPTQKGQTMTTDQDWDLVDFLERLAERVRVTPPVSVSVVDRPAVRTVAPEESGNWSFVERRPDGPLETTVTIRWQP